MEGLDSAAFAVTDEKGLVPDDTRDAFFRKLRMKNENRSCFECTARNPTWNSLTYGVYLCLECSGHHRRKGVHLSFVRSVELDRFTPDQMIQMAVGGNGKAWEFFKAHEMGKTSSSGRAVDYSSKIALRYKQQIEKDTKLTCEKYQVACKLSSQSSGAFTPSPIVTDPVDEAAEVPPPAAAKAAAPVAKAGGYASAAAVPLAPKSHSGVQTSNVVVRKVVESEPKPTSPSSVIPKPSGFTNQKHMAKDLDFDFDFDELEKEASKPPVPKAVAAPQPVPGVNVAKTPTFDKAPTFVAKAAPPTASAASTSSGEMSRFEGKKGISSADFFGQDEESPSQRLQRESRYSKLSGSTAIGSSDFFGNDNPENSTMMGEDLKDLTRGAVSQAGEFFSTYLAKGYE